MDKVAVQENEAIYEDEVDIELDAESLANYLDICVPISEDEEQSNDTLPQLVRQTSEICTEYEIDNGVDCSASE